MATRNLGDMCLKTFRRGQSPVTNVEQEAPDKSIPLEKLPSNVPSEGRKDSRPAKREQLIKDHIARFARLPASSVFDLQPNASAYGLTNEAAVAALRTHGPNLHSTERPPSFLLLFAIAIANPFNFLLIILASVSIGTGDKATFSVMMCMVIASTGLRLWQDVRSTSQASKLLSSVTTRVRVLRQRTNPSSVPFSEEVEIDRRDIVPGDLLTFASGDVFAGDCVVILAESLTVAQASLTGEMMPVEKMPRLDLAPAQFDFDIVDNANVCLAGTSVATGNGTALVISTGSETYMASIAKDLAKKRPMNTFQAGTRNVSYILMAFMAVMAPTVLVIQGCISKKWKSAVFFAISVAVGLTPEMLPMIVTSNLALSAMRVARKKVIVKRFDAIQSLGAVQILCSDKTGTLTSDVVQLSTSVASDGTPADLPLKLAYVNSALQTGTRSLLDSAIVEHVRQMIEKGGPTGEHVNLDTWVKVSEVPFDSSRRLLSVLVSRDFSVDKKGLLITKGAVEEVIDRCSQLYDYPSVPSSGTLDQFEPGNSPPLTVDAKRDILATAKRLNEDGLRLVAVACRSTVAMQFMTVNTNDESDLVFIGFLGFLDPVKPDAAEAIENLASLGVQVRILTGDSPFVAAKVARTLGILPTVSASPDHVIVAVDKEDDLVLTGSQLAALSDDPVAYNEAIECCLIYAKLSPHQKLEVVQALCRGGGGRSVAFLGDGVNDALAIRAADVGISVDSGTEIAKEAADVILLEKSLGVIAHGVVEGRKTFINTIKYIKMTCSSNFGNVFSILVASAWLPYEPMLPLQLLIQNLLYDFSQASIPWDNVDAKLLRAPTPWNARSILRFMIFMGPTSSVFDICIFSLNWFRYGIRDLNSPLVARARTDWFIEGAVTQILIVHVLRTSKIPFLQSIASIPVIAVTFSVGVVAMVIPYIPGLHTAIKMMPPLPEYYGFLAAIVLSYMLLVQLVKTVYKRIFHEWL